MTFMTLNQAELNYCDLSLSFEVPTPINTDEHPGSFAVVLAGFEEQALVQRLYGRTGLALKCIPLNVPDMHPAFANWGGVELGMASFVQNLLALYGLAPRVYGLVRINGTHAAQVTDYIEETDPKARIDELLQAFKCLGIQTCKNYDVEAGKGNWRDGLFVDFSGLSIGDGAVGDILQMLRTKATMKKGRSAGSAYQAVDELEIPGDRPADREFPQWAAPTPATVFPTPTSVLDIGCNIGHFLRLAAQRPGVRRVVGVEKLVETADICRMINVLLGYWNIDVITAKLPDEADALPAIDWDLVVCLSTIKYLGDADAIPWLASLAPALWLEGHGDIGADHYTAALTQSYDHIDRLPDTVDNMRRVQFLCRRRQD